MIADFQMAQIAITVIRSSLARLPNDSRFRLPDIRSIMQNLLKVLCLLVAFKKALKLMMQVNWLVIIWELTGVETGSVRRFTPGMFHILLFY